LPALQISVLTHVLLQLPQFLGSFALSTQCGGVPHMAWVLDVPHGWHTPARQLAVAAHCVPQAPQLLESVFSSTQTVVAPAPHIRWVVGHTHALFTQLAPPPQARPHPPQLCGSSMVETQVLPAPESVPPSVVATPPALQNC
jgi:hypothetical protein